MDLVYLLSLSVCFAVTVRTGQYRRFPLFAAATLAAILFEVAYQPFTAAWLRSWYAALVTPLLALRALSVAEAFVRSSIGFRQRKLIAATALCFALLFATVIAWRFNALDVLHSAIQARRVVVVGLAAFLGVYVLLMWSLGYRRAGVADFHVFLMFSLCSVMACSTVLRMAHPVGIWAALNDASYAACSLVYFTWAWLFSIRELPPYLLPLENHCLGG